VVGASALLLLSPSLARAGSPYEVGDNGSEQLGRAGAWVARASTALAAVENPGALATQRAGVDVGMNLALRRSCFTRLKAAGDTTDDGFAPGAAYPRVCDDGAPLPVGYAALTFPVGERTSLGFALAGPSGVPNARWPSFVDGRPAPQRYLALESTALFAQPTVALSHRVLPSLSVGASFAWGVAWVKSSAATAALPTAGQRPADNDVKSTVEATDAFVPSGTLGALANLGPLLDVGVAYKLSAPIDARGDARTEVNAFAPRARDGDTSRVVYGDTSRADCGQAGGVACGDGGNARVTIPIPMELKVGARFHLPRARRGDERPSRRDPMADDLFDLELDLEWTQSSAIDATRVRFPSERGAGTIPVAGTAGVIPPEADVPRAYRDVIGVRMGGDVSVVPRRLSFRVGGSYETRADREATQNVDTLAGARVGVAAGATLRLITRERDASGAAGPRTLDVSNGVAQIHVLGREATSGAGVGAFTGVACASGDASAGVCADGTPAHRTPWAVNLGAITSVVHMFHVGLGATF
jgi:long-subunit fatty acid transport protein